MQATPKVLDFFIIDLLFSGMNYSTSFLFYVLNTGTEDHHQNGLLRMIQGTLKKNTKVLNEGNASVSLKERFANGTYQEFEVNMHLVYNLWVMSFMQTGTIDVLSRK